jgi:RNA polymerase sigma-70 factor (ECF subfamily)
MAQGLELVRERIDERQFQIFDLYVTKDWPAGRVAKTLGISIARVYLTKHRVAAMLKRAVRQLEKAAEQALRKVD